MKKKYGFQLLLRLMRLSLSQLLLLACVLGNAYATRGSAQGVLNEKVSLTLKNRQIEGFFREIEQQVNIRFVYSARLIGAQRKVNVQVKDQPLHKILDDILIPLELKYRVFDNLIIISREVSTEADHRNENVPENKTINALTEDPALMVDLAVKGRVIDEKGEGLPGVSILVKGMQRGTTTQTDGSFSISVPDENAVLVFSFVGFKSQEIVVGSRTELSVELASEEKSLDELVVVGYGSQKQREVTGSIATIKTEQLENQPVGQLTQKLQGRIAGVQINQASGQPGGGMAIRIRGAASINAGNGPLYVIDGFPVVGDINTINPNEVESLSILKGPSAAALYGSRAANGVVLITTKRSRSGETQIQFDVSHGWGQIPQKGRPDLMDAKEFLQFQKELYEDRIRYEGFKGGIPAIYQNPEQYTGKSTDWYEELLRNTSMSRYNVTVSVGKDKFNSATTVGYFKEDGAVLNTGFERYSIRSNNEFRVNKHILTGVSVAPTFQSSQNFNTDGEFQLLYAALATPPIFSPFDTNPDGSPQLIFAAPGTFTQPNWYRTLTESTNRLKSLRLLSNAFAEFEFLNGFRFKSSVSIDLLGSNQRAFKPSTVGTASNSNLPPNMATASYNTAFYYSWLTENTLNYTKTFARDHSFDVLAGYSAQKFREENNSLTGTDFPDDAVSWIDAAAIRNGNSNLGEWSLISFFSRLNYNYKGKYILSASLRRDGSSRFGSDNRWGAFPSVSAGWVVSDEKFMSRLPTVDYLKVRAEYGTSGNFNIGNYTQYGNIASTNYVFGNGLVSGRSPVSIGNSQLTWEKSNGLDVGIDVGLLKNRVFVTADYYTKVTRDMLYQIDIPSATGFNNIQSNVGEFKFWGYEFAVSTKNLVGGFKWNTDFNISFNRNKAVRLGTNNTPIGGIGEQGESSYWKTEVGKPIALFYGYVWDGVYMTQEEFDTQPKHITSAVGTTRMKDLNNDGVINSKDKTYIGNPNPDFLFGITNNFSYKNFDLGVVVSGSYGADMFVHRGWNEIQDGNFNVRKDLKDRWRSLENPGAGAQARSLSGSTAFGRFTSTKWLFPASYLTIKNITLGYTVPQFLKAIKQARLYASVQQALVISNYVGVNPEASKNGLEGLKLGFDGTAYPIPRTFALGLNVTF